MQVREGILMSALPIKQVLTSDVTGAWLESYDPGDRKFIKIGFLLLENGQVSVCRTLNRCAYIIAHFGHAQPAEGV